MQGINPLHLHILTCIASQLQNLKRLLLLDKLIWQEGFLITLSHPKLIISKSIETVTLYTCITSILNNYTGYMDKLQHLYTPRNCNSPYSIAKESYYSRYNTLSELHRSGGHTGIQNPGATLSYDLQSSVKLFLVISSLGLSAWQCCPKCQPRPISAHN